MLMVWLYAPLWIVRLLKLLIKNHADSLLIFPKQLTRKLKEGDANKIVESAKIVGAPPKPNTATRYELDGNYIVVDDVTKEILQVSEPNYIPNQL